MVDASIPGQKTPDTNATFSERRSRLSPSAHNLLPQASDMAPNVYDACSDEFTE